MASTETPEAQGLGDAQKMCRGAPAQGLAHPRLVDRAVRPARPGNLDLVEAGQADLQGAQRLLQGLLEVRPMAITSPTDFICGGERRVGLREFLEGEARDLGDDVVDRRLEGRGRSSR